MFVLVCVYVCWCWSMIRRLLAQIRLQASTRSFHLHQYSGTLAHVDFVAVGEGAVDAEDRNKVELNLSQQTFSTSLFVSDNISPSFRVHAVNYYVCLDFEQINQFQVKSIFGPFFSCLLRRFSWTVQRKLPTRWKREFCLISKWESHSFRNKLLNNFSFLLLSGEWYSKEENLRQWHSLDCNWLVRVRCTVLEWGRTHLSFPSSLQHRR